MVGQELRSTTALPARISQRASSSYARTSTSGGGLAWVNALPAGRAWTGCSSTVPPGRSRTVLV